MYFWTICKNTRCILPDNFYWVTVNEIEITFSKNKERILEEILNSDEKYLALIESIGNQDYVIDRLRFDKYQIIENDDKIILRIFVLF